MKYTDNKHIKTALIAMAVIILGTELLVEFIAKESLNIGLIVFWFSITIVIIYYVYALQMSNKNDKHNKQS